MPDIVEKSAPGKAAEVAAIARAEQPHQEKCVVKAPSKRVSGTRFGGRHVAIVHPAMASF